MSLKAVPTLLRHRRGPNEILYGMTKKQNKQGLTETTPWLVAAREKFSNLMLPDCLKLHKIIFGIKIFYICTNESKTIQISIFHSNRIENFRQVQNNFWEASSIVPILFAAPEWQEGMETVYAKFRRLVRSVNIVGNHIKKT